MSKSVLANYPNYEATIGIEVHVQLKTDSKMFCSCVNIFGAEPNTNICKVCVGMLGSLPVVNRKAIDYAIMAGVATECTIAKVSEFARKHYMYPDLPKNYQITQGDKPICFSGKINVTLPEQECRTIRINRIHMEEDAGKNIHGQGNESWVDLNRSGTPLLEIVSEPDITSADEAVAYLEKLRAIVRYLGISEANMEEGSFRADINISVKTKEVTCLGSKVEIKNVNSFRFIHQAIEHEIERQIELILAGGKVSQETRLWNEKQQKTVFMRSKETADDYRYLPDPDLPLIIIDNQWLERMSQDVPELPDSKLQRFISQYELSPYEAANLTNDKDLADFYEAVVAKCQQTKKAANWILRDVLGFLNDKKESLANMQISPEMLAELIVELEKGVINNRAAQEIFLEMADTGKYPSIIIQERGLEQIGSIDELRHLVQQVIHSNPEPVANFKAGNERLLGFFVGQAMKLSGGKGNPKIFGELVREMLK